MCALHQRNPEEQKGVSVHETAQIKSDQLLRETLLNLIQFEEGERR